MPDTAAHRDDAQQLHKALSVLGNVAITLSGITPCASVFIIAPVLLAAEGTGTFLSFVAAAVIGVCMALCWGELGSMFPFAGGQFEVVGRVLGRAAGFVSFACMLVLVIFVPSSIALGGGQYLSVVIPHANEHVVGALVMLGAAGVAILSIKTNGWVTGVFLAIELLALLTISILGFAFEHQPWSYLIHPKLVTATAAHISPVTLSVVALGVATAIFSYNGYDGAIQLSEETEGHRSGIAKAILWALAITVVAELTPITATMIGAPSLTGLAHASSPMAYVITALGGKTLNTVISLGVLLAIINATIAICLQYGRTLFGSGRNRAWPEPVSRWLAAIHPRWKTPWVATAVVGVGGAALTYFSSIAALVTFTGVTLVVLYALSAISAIVSRITQRDHDRPYRMPLWPLPPVVALAALVYVLTKQTAHDIAIMAAVIVGSLAYYYGYLHRRRGTKWVLEDNPAATASPLGAPAAPVTPMAPASLMATEITAGELRTDR